MLEPVIEAMVLLSNNPPAPVVQAKPETVLRADALQLPLSINVRFESEVRLFVTSVPPLLIVKMTDPTPVKLLWVKVTVWPLRIVKDAPF